MLNTLWKPAAALSVGAAAIVWSALAPAPAQTEPYLRAAFERFYANRDGTVTAAEFRSAHADDNFILHSSISGTPPSRHHPPSPPPTPPSPPPTHAPSAAHPQFPTQHAQKPIRRLRSLRDFSSPIMTPRFIISTLTPTCHPPCRAVCINCQPAQYAPSPPRGELHPIIHSPQFFPTILHIKIEAPVLRAATRCPKAPPSFRAPEFPLASVAAGYLPILLFLVVALALSAALRGAADAGRRG